jgi:hypothetical protein
VNHPNQLKTLNSFDFGKEDIFEVIFTHRKTAQAAMLFVKWLKNVGGECTRNELSRFSHDLAEGRIREGITLKRSNFYRTVLRTLVDLGLVSLQPRFDPRKKSKTSYVYAPIRQPIPKKPPLGGETFWRKAWFLCQRWNQQFTEEE